jgi:hypothetical protein
MKIKFEKWIENGHFSENAKHLLGTSVTCYKAEAYTAALLMGYLGFFVILKERIIKANKPALYPPPLWESLLQELRNEDKWEERIFTSALQQEKTNSTKVRIQDPIFVINDNIRNQIRYWKDRRNDCAHNKDNAITIAHVESFWSFLESNLQKITVEGGKATLLNRFKLHYDDTYTPAKKDVSPLIREIKSTVEKTELADFWKQLFDEITDLWDYSNEIEVIRGVFKLNDQELSDSLIQYLNADQKLLMEYINLHPSIIGSLGMEAHEVRNFWRTKIKKLQNVMGVYASMLRNNLIPVGEVESANELIANLYKYPANLDDHFVLAANTFGEALYKNLFVIHSKSDFKYWQFMNQHSDIFSRYVELYPLKDDVVEILCREMAKIEWNAQFLQERLNQLFRINSSKKAEFKERALALSLTLPEPIYELAT